MKRKRNAWTGPEVIKLRELYPSASWDEINAAMPRHGRSAIRSKAKWLKIARDPYAASRHPLIAILRARRRELNRPMVEVAAAAGVERTTLHHAENGRGHQLPHGTTLEPWAWALDFKLELVPLTPTKGKTHDLQSDL